MTSITLQTCTAVVAGAALIAGVAQAAGTPAGTTIQNVAHVSYDLGGVPITVSSNTTTLDVAEILNVNVTVLTPSVAVTAGAIQRVIVMRVTNTGNGVETFRLSGSSAVAGDDFDPIPSTPYIYFDSDDSGTLSSADVAYTPGVNDPTLAADQAVTLLIVNDIPNGLPNGASGRTRLTAQALTGTGAPGTVFPGAGTGGVDAVVGTSTASQSGVGTYVVSALQLTAIKAQTIVDPFGGSRPVPGARIHYQVVVTPSGSGTANAVTFSDAIPTNTAYVAGTLRLNGVALTDAADADAGQFISAPSPRVVVMLGTLTHLSGVQTIEFAVTIN